jgi:hypothetical protein
VIAECGFIGIPLFIEGQGMVASGIIAQHISISAVFLVSSLVCATGLLFFRAVVLNNYVDSQKMK